MNRLLTDRLVRRYDGGTKRTWASCGGKKRGNWEKVLVTCHLNTIIIYKKVLSLIAKPVRMIDASLEVFDIKSLADTNDGQPCVPT